MFQITWFVALLTIDERRVEQRRNACCCYVVHQRQKAEEILETKDEAGAVNCVGGARDQGLTGLMFSRLARLLVSPLVRAGVMAATLGLLTTGLWGVTSLKMEFRPEWMLDPETECEYRHWQDTPSSITLFQSLTGIMPIKSSFLQTESLANFTLE